MSGAGFSAALARPTSPKRPAVGEHICTGGPLPKRAAALVAGTRLAPVYRPRSAHRSLVGSLAAFALPRARL
jgi:hypothetical protein